MYFDPIYKEYSVISRNIDYFIMFELQSFWYEALQPVVTVRDASESMKLPRYTAVQDSNTVHTK
jgi:hypothetical protein